jgi:hypothetical protein
MKARWGYLTNLQHLVFEGRDYTICGMAYCGDALLQRWRWSDEKKTLRRKCKICSKHEWTIKKKLGTRARA